MYEVFQAGVNVTLIGLGVAFFVLTCLIVVVHAMSAVARFVEAEHPPAAVGAPAVALSASGATAGAVAATVEAAAVVGAPAATLAVSASSAVARRALVEPRPVEPAVAGAIAAAVRTYRARRQP